MTTWVYWQSEPRLWTVGYYSPDGQRHPESDWESTDHAAQRANWLNGGDPPNTTGDDGTAAPELLTACRRLTTLVVGYYEGLEIIALVPRDLRAATDACIAAIARAEATL